MATCPSLVSRVIIVVTEKLQILLIKNNFMDEEIFEFAKDNDLSLDEAEKLQEVVEETGLDPDDANELVDLF